MKINIKKKLNVPINVPIKLAMVNNDICSDVKIYIPKNKEGKPLIEKGKYWYVYCYFKNPKTGKKDYKFIIKADINREKSIQKRKKKAKELKNALIYMINEKGFTPFNKNYSKFQIKNIFISDALNLAYKNRCSIWSDRMKADVRSHLKKFINFLKENDLFAIYITDLNKRHITAYLNGLMKLGVSPKTRNNHKASISALLTQLVDDNYLKYNICLNISNLKTTPKKNKAFSKSQLLNIKKYLLKNDPYLYEYILFIGYGFMRPITVNRIQIKNILLEQKIIKIQTKTGVKNIYLIDKLIKIIEKYDIKNMDLEFTLFTPFNKPAIWNTKTENKQSFFSKKFKKVKTNLKLTDEYSLYSFRHTFILDLYNSFLNQGFTQNEIKNKLLPITRHSTFSGLENYLRGIGAILPDDFENDINLDF